MIARADSRLVTTSGSAAPLPLLETKLYAPRWRTGLVSRPALVERLHLGTERRLTVVSAPAGFGKTTLLAQWLADRAVGGGPVGWVSLDSSENEPALFWSYVIRAIQTAHPSVGVGPLSLLRSPQPPPTESLLTALINEIASVPAGLVLVLDDYHVIDAPAVHGAMAFLLDHLPPRMHLVLASRSDPPLPLSRLRARGELTELRSADLRFTPEEATAFLNRVMALGLSVGDLETLERRTEGWVAGLKLAGLSMRGRTDPHGFVEAFAGDNRYVADYLVEEVLQAEPAPVRQFLLDTAILDRLSGPLCDAVAGEPGSRALLDGLERKNLFVVPLDDTRSWYRYHHLFAEVLQSQALREAPERVRDCHRRASAWYEHNDLPADALRHAVAAEDWEQAATLLERAWPAKDRSYQSRRWLERVKALPDALVRARPVLSMGYAWALLNSGDLEAAEARLADVEGWLVGTEDPRLKSLPAEVAAARVYLSESRGDFAESLEHAKRSLDLIPETDPFTRASGTALLGLALWANGDLEAGHRTFERALALMRLAGETLSVVRGTFVLGDIRVAQGRLHEAEASYLRGLELAGEQTGSGAPETDELYLGLSELHREWGDMEAALRFLQSIPASTEHAGNRQRWCTAMARLREAHGDVVGALDLLDEAEELQVRGPLPQTRPIPALRARLWLAHGRLDEATSWARQRGLSVDDDLSYMREFEHLTLARLLLARHGADGAPRSLHDAIRLLDRLANAAEDGGRTGTAIEALALRALAERALGNVGGALDPLERALTLAEPRGYLGLFIEEGAPMRELLRHTAARGAGGAHARRLLAVTDGPPPLLAPRAPAPATGSAQLLTTRELEILRLIGAGLRNQQIAKHLFISPATVKRHIANSYLKLGVGHRTEALIRAKELNLL